MTTGEMEWYIKAWNILDAIAEEKTEEVRRKAQEGL